MAVTIDPATKVKELSVPSQHGGAPAEFVLTDTSLYVKRPKDRKHPLFRCLRARAVLTPGRVAAVVARDRGVAVLDLDGLVRERKALVGLVPGGQAERDDGDDELDRVVVECGVVLFFFSKGR